MCVRAVGKAVELNKQRSPKQLPHPTSGIPEQPDSSGSARPRGAPPGASGSDAAAPPLAAGSGSSPPLSSASGQASDTSGPDSDSSEEHLLLFLCSCRDSEDRVGLNLLCVLFPDVSPFCVQPRVGEGPQAGDPQEPVSSPTGTQFDFSPSNLEHLQEEDQEAFRCSRDLDLTREKIYFTRFLLNLPKSTAR